MKPLISIIVPNFNGLRFLQDCFVSIFAQTYDNFELIFIDNGSSDNSIEFVRKNFPKVEIIANKENLGFARANNQGFEISRGKYIVTLNNDTVVDKNWLTELVGAVEADAEIGMVASKIFLSGENNKIDSVGVNIALDGMTKQRGGLEFDSGQYNKIEEVLFPSACAALYRRKMIEEIGFFDEDFFAYCEDSDLGLRGRLAGWRAVFVPSAIIYHDYSGTAGKYSSFKAYLVERNHAWLVLKNFPLELIFLFPFFTLLRFILQFYAVLIKKGPSFKFVKQESIFIIAGTIMKAYFDAFKKMPEFIIKRKIIQKNKKLSRYDFYLLLYRYRLSFTELVYRK